MLNRIEEKNEIIYCDYEEDIFERNIKGGISTFTQIKLYSSNFSFSKEEIQKSISHFFMLFVKGEYLFDNVNLVFVTNSSVAKELKGNDANLLREWWEHQNNISNDLMERCKVRVKQIIDEYISEVYNQKISTALKNELQKAKNIYDSLPNDIWIKFIQSIKWQFDGIEKEKAIPNLLTSIQNLMVQLPLPLDYKKLSTYTSVLHFEISQRTTQSFCEDKKLTNELIDTLLLKEGNKNDQWYAYAFDKWQQVSEIPHFNIGAFYEVINAARHCRWYLFKTTHSELWLRILKIYIELPETLIVCKRKGIYEYLWLLLSPDPNTFIPKGSLKNEQSLVEFYFKEFSHRNSFADIEDDIVLLQLVQTTSLLEPSSFEKKEVERWAKTIDNFIDTERKKTKNADDLCLLLELKGTFEFHCDPLKSLQNKTESGLYYYRMIIPNLKEAKIYTISRLSDQLNEIIKMTIKTGYDHDDVISPIEIFLEEIENEAGKVGKEHLVAHNLVERGSVYLNKPSSQNYLKALDCFYKAQILWYHETTKEGFILALINIAQVYAALGMNIAAKYYGLCSVWASLHMSDHYTFNRISDGYAIVFHSDFSQGAWFSALNDFEMYLRSRLEFKATELNVDDDHVFRKTVLDVSCLLTSIVKLRADLGVLIDYYKNSLGWVYQQHIQLFVELFEEKFLDEEFFRRTISGKLSDAPLNDLGKKRTIAFNILGVEWKIMFDNTAILNAIAEEFCSLLQITLCEIGLCKADLHLLKTNAVIIIKQAPDYNTFDKQKPSHNDSVWEVFIPSFNSKELKEIKWHYGFIATNIKRILNDISLLRKDEFETIFTALYTSQKLGDKGLSVNTYQKVYFNFLKEEDFDKSKRSDFAQGPQNDVTKRPEFIPSFNGLSSKYDKTTCINNITQRYKNMVVNLHVSLSEWKKDPNFIKLIQSYRSEGWLDWQILMALMNFVFSYKANAYVQSLPLHDDEKLKAFEEEFIRIKRMDEKDCYLEIPVNYLQSDEFRFVLVKTPADALDSYGLENNMQYPNFNAIRRFLEEKFAFDKDDDTENDPLRDV